MGGCFQPGEGHSRGFLRDCEIFAKVRCELWSSLAAQCSNFSLIIFILFWKLLPAALLLSSRDWARLRKQRRAMHWVLFLFSDKMSVIWQRKNTSVSRQYTSQATQKLNLFSSPPFQLTPNGSSHHRAAEAVSPKAEMHLGFQVISCCHHRCSDPRTFQHFNLNTLLASNFQLNNGPEPRYSYCNGQQQIKTSSSSSLAPSLRGLSLHYQWQHW